MIQKFFKNIYVNRHFWRRASFSEVAELYLTRLMRIIAINVGAAFMSVFMLQNGYSVVDVALFWAAYYGFKVLISLPLAQFVARFGAKKAIIVSNFLYIPSMIAFIFLPDIGLIALVITAVFQSSSAALYDIAHGVNFSRAKSADNAGRQVATMNIIEQIAKAVSPLIGGLLAMFFDPRVTIAVSAVFFLFAAFPSMGTPDTRSKGFSLAPKGFPWKMASRSLLINAPMGFDIFASGSGWSIFLATVIFTAGSNQIYAELGALTAIVFLITMVITRLYGKLIDSSSGGKLLFWSAIGNVIVHVLRVVVRSPLMVLGANTAKEALTAGYSMPYMRGAFDVADRTGYRVFYMGMTVMITNIGSGLAALALAAILFVIDSGHGFSVFYLLTAAVASLILLSKFRVYKQV